jgi:hypothetical protein
MRGRADPPPAGQRKAGAQATASNKRQRGGPLGGAAPSNGGRDPLRGARCSSWNSELELVGAPGDPTP